MAHKRKCAAKEDMTCNGRSEMTSAQKKLHLHADNSDAMEKQSSNGVKQEKNPKVPKMVLRRSERLKSSVLPSENIGVKPVVEHVDLVGNEKDHVGNEKDHVENEEDLVENANDLVENEEDLVENEEDLVENEEDHIENEEDHIENEEDHIENENDLVENEEDLVENEKEEEAPDNSQQVNKVPIAQEMDLEREAPFEGALPEINGRSLEEKVDYLIMVADKLKSEVYKRPNEGSHTDLSYKSLYFTSQKQIEALVEKNYQLVRKLRYARGKIAAYEEMQNSAMGSKVYLLPPLGNAAEVCASLSAQAVQNCSSPAATSPGNPNARKRYPRK